MQEIKQKLWDFAFIKTWQEHSLAEVSIEQKDSGKYRCEYNSF